MSVWNQENIVDVAESVGIASLNKDVQEHLARDVEYRISQVLEEALKFVRHGKRTTLSTQDISQALRLLDVEPLYGYESTRPLRFGEASIGPGQPLFYVEDEEVDFEKLINAVNNLNTEQLKQWYQTGKKRGTVLFAIGASSRMFKSAFNSKSARDE